MHVPISRGAPDVVLGAGAGAGTGVVVLVVAAASQLAV